LTRAVEVTEQIEAGGITMLRQSLEMLGCPMHKNSDNGPDS